MGMLCFSANWSNPVQWSHYADFHRGVCLGFAISDQAELYKVRYTKQRLKANERALDAEGPVATAHLIKLLSTKFSHWQYENEHRLFVPLSDKDERGYYFRNFGEAMQLREIIVGAMSEISRDEVASAVGDLQGVKLVKARLAFRSFNVVKQRSTQLWK